MKTKEINSICKLILFWIFTLQRYTSHVESSAVFASRINKELLDLTDTTPNGLNETKKNVFSHNYLRGIADTGTNVTCTFDMKSDVEKDLEKEPKKDLCKGYLYWCTPLKCTVTGTYAHTLRLAYRIEHSNSHAQDDDTCGTACKQIIQSCLKKPATFEQVIRSLINRWRQTDSPFEDDDSVIETKTTPWHDVDVSMNLQYQPAKPPDIRVKKPQNTSSSSSPAWSDAS